MKPGKASDKFMVMRLTHAEEKPQNDPTRPSLKPKNEKLKQKKPNEVNLKIIIDIAEDPKNGLSYNFNVLEKKSGTRSPFLLSFLESSHADAGVEGEVKPAVGNRVGLPVQIGQKRASMDCFEEEDSRSISSSKRLKFKDSERSMNPSSLRSRHKNINFQEIKNFGCLNGGSPIPFKKPQGNASFPTKSGKKMTQYKKFLHDCVLKSKNILTF